MRRLISALIVVVALGITGGLAVCAVVRIRDIAARTQCQKNLMEIGMAILNSYDTYGTFPPAIYLNKRLPDAKQLSWLAYISAFMEQQQAYIEFPDEKRRFHCPTDPTVTPPDTAVFTNYVGISGVGPGAATLQIGYPGVGFFGYERTIKQEDIQDGLANTLAVMETKSNLGPWTAGGSATVRPIDPATTPYVGTGRPFGSGHRAVTLAVFADGSVHTLTNAIHPEILEAFATIAGGEKTGPLSD